MQSRRGSAHLFIIIMLSIMLASCGTGGSDGSSNKRHKTARYDISGSVIGLSGTGLVLQNNGGDDLPITSEGAFVFNTPVADGEEYLVTVMSQPTGPNQTCTVNGGSGTVDGADVSDVTVTCSTNAYTIGGTASGLSGTGLVLQDNGGDDLPITANDAFVFNTPVADGSEYLVTVLTQPSGPNQTCTVNGGSGIVNGTDVSDITVTCSTNAYTIGGTASGIDADVVLQNNGDDDLTVSGDGPFEFLTPVADTAGYQVTVLSSPGQGCAIANGSGAVSGADVTDVVLTCLPAVGPLYILNGTDWNDYVVDDGGDMFSATDTACAPLDNACLHAGELRSIEVPGYASCTGLSAEDDLGAFDWTCVVMDSAAHMVSTGLRDGKHLSDLVDFSNNEWWPNRLVVSESAVPVFTSGESVWWGNPVKRDNDGSDGLGMSAGDIIIVTADAGASYTIGADKVGFVIEPGVTLTGPDSASTVVTGTSRAFLWMEGDIGAPAGRGASLDGVLFSVLDALNVSDATDEGILLSDSDRNTLRGLSVSNSLDGIALYNSSGNTLTDITANLNILNGIYFEGSSGNAIANYTASENYTAALVLKESSDNLVSDLEASMNYAGVILINSSDGNSFDNIELEKNDYGLFLLLGPSYNTFRHVSIVNCPEVPMHMWEADFNSIEGLRFTNNNYSSGLQSSSGNYLKDLVFENNYGIMAMFKDSQNNIIENLTAFNNNQGFVLLGGAYDNVFSNMTIANTYLGALEAANAFSGPFNVDNVFINISLVNNDQGIDFRDSSGYTIENLAVTDHEQRGIRLVDSSDNTFTGLLEVGNNGLGDCHVEAGTNPGLVNTTCTESGLYGSFTYGIGNTSDATLYNGVTLASSFVGKVTSDDTANADDTSGLAAYDVITDWTNFENAYRGWGRDGGAFPDATNRDQCISGEDCRIWDWSLWTADTVVRDVLALPTGSDVITHTWSDLSTTTFLRNAVEIYGDGIGNDNGLCESDEKCLYTPNIGSYQGHGNLVEAATIDAGGTLENITLMQYENNGY